MLKKIFFVSLICNICLLNFFYESLDAIINIICLIFYEFIFSIFITLICASFTIIIVNLLHYLRCNNFIMYNYFLNLVKIFTIQTPELKVLSLIIMNKFTSLNLINLYSVATIYNMHLTLLFFQEISNLDYYAYITINMYTNRITLFLKYTIMLYYKYMKNKTLLMFFYILGDNWILYKNDKYSTLYLFIYNIITTSIYLRL